MVVISVYIYGVKIIKKFRWESGFLRGFHGPPLCTNRSAGYLMQLSVNRGCVYDEVCQIAKFCSIYLNVAV